MWAALLGVAGGRDESVTSTMTVNFLRPFAPGPVLAEARLLKRGKRMVFGEVVLRAESAEEVSAHVTTSWAVIAPGRGGGA
jgi:acyl-coenzyme A thioesterase PaaI-like protein